ncbi:UNVERIFIED_CONTAM: PPOX class probable F420-dependent enzyme [Streptomyces graminofaciens]
MSAAGHREGISWNARPVKGVGDSMTQGPAPRALSDEALSDLLAGQQFGTLATVKQSGHPHLTTMVYSWDPRARMVRMSTTADRIKVRHLQRNPRASLHVQGGDVWSFAVAEGTAEASETTTVPGDAVGRELLAMIPAAAKPEDEDAFLKGLVAERRVVIRLRVERLYGTALDTGGQALDSAD